MDGWMDGWMNGWIDNIKQNFLLCILHHLALGQRKSTPRESSVLM